jgi:hypothetical protein
LDEPGIELMAPRNGSRDWEILISCTKPGFSKPLMADVPTEPPSSGLEGKAAIVTGADRPGQGIGNRRAIAQKETHGM